MKACLRVEKNIDESAIKMMSKTCVDLLISGAYTVVDLPIINPTFIHKTGDIIQVGKNEIKMSRDYNSTPIKETENDIDSFTIFSNIFNLGKKIDNLIIKSDLENIDKHTDYEIYKIVIQSLLERDTYKNLFYLIDEIVRFFEKYGFVSFPESDYEEMKDECVILDFLTIVYIMYEAFWLREQYANATHKYPKIYDYVFSKIKCNSILKQIQSNLEFIDSHINNYCRFETEYNSDNESWETKIIFNNALMLGVYELKVQLSRDNNDETIGICKNPACNNTFKRYGFKQQYCNEYECNLSRQNQRKQKSRDNKKSSK